ncbi:hypothetical protein ACFQDN_25905 [Pseudomonas asuensis]|uniref:Uncharacterized protein n=1 Tax=Pseudomonas asuensis TaxID=1825787 RepID=A0ABQ2GWB6_9PSED|nr:hypothetical protein [Pseudomonas asuensis]GGM16892.1 hypothetical protein GCM10009425_29880 [Pseudomonas asuensis]
MTTAGLPSLLAAPNWRDALISHLEYSMVAAVLYQNNVIVLSIHPDTPGDVQRRDYSDRDGCLPASMV